MTLGMYVENISLALGQSAKHYHVPLECFKSLHNMRATDIILQIHEF